MKGIYSHYRRACIHLMFVAVLIVIGISVASAQIGSSGSNVAATKHNLTASGPGTVKVGSQSDVCLFCHTPHAASPAAPLWNREHSGAYYQTYESTTLVATVGQPSGSSRLCLSCHDGTIGLAQTFNPNNAGGSTVYISASDRGYIGTDLRDDHPISFTYNASLAATKGQLRDPATLPPELPLDHNQQLQCTTCHDPHDDQFGHFLRMDNRESQMCVTCHQMEDWSTSAHAVSTATLRNATGDDWDNLRANILTVRDAGCASCHRPHSAGGRQRLLRHEAEENNCLNCHDGSVAQTNIDSVIQSISNHGTRQTTGVHDPTENPLTMPKHAECVDCHNPHRTGTGTAQAPFVKPAMAGVSGLSSTGSFIASAPYEYQVCYKCHSRQNFAEPLVERYIGSDNIADDFSPSNASYHPVEAQGRNTQVPSLLQPYTTSSMIYCTDCHGNDNPSGPKGPHGSVYRPLLVREYVTVGDPMETPQTYALCYQCHSRTSILANESFSRHRHYIEELRTPCSVCHDPHGVASADATNLMNFDRARVFPAAGGQGPEFRDTGIFSGNCTLTCHSFSHENVSYP